MQSVLLNIKTDPKTKQDLKNFASELGVTSTALVNLLIKQALRDKTITISANKGSAPRAKNGSRHKKTNTKNSSKLNYFDK